MHPINIIVRDHRTFGRKPIIGTHVITNLLLDKPPKEDKIRNIVSDESKEGNLFVFLFMLLQVFLIKKNPNILLYLYTDLIC